MWMIEEEEEEEEAARAATVAAAAAAAAEAICVSTVGRNALYRLVEVGSFPELCLLHTTTQLLCLS
jgi:hypothetical protein